MSDALYYVMETIQWFGAVMGLWLAIIANVRLDRKEKDND